MFTDPLPETSEAKMARAMTARERKQLAVHESTLRAKAEQEDLRQKERDAVDAFNAWISDLDADMVLALQRRSADVVASLGAAAKFWRSQKVAS